MTWRGVMPLVLAAGLAACASPATSSVPPAGSFPAASTSEGPTAEPAVFDFARTAWRVEAIDGQPLAVGAAPTLTFDPREGAKGSGGAFSGCTSFGFEWALDAGRAQIRPQGVDLGTCSGIAGQIRLRRDAPPIGDAGRAVLDLLRTGEWRVMTAPGIAAGTGPSGIRFGDTRVLATGECGFGGIFRMVQGAGVKFEELGWDTTDGCDAAHDAARTVLKRLLETATTARLGADGTSVVFSGPNGEVVLGR